MIPSEIGVHEASINKVELQPKVKEIKTTNAFLRTVKSPLFWATLGTLTVITFTAVVVPLLAPLLTKFIVPVVSIGGVVALATYIVRNERAIFEFTLNYTLISLKDPWNEIDDGIVLGKIPLKSHGDHLKFLAEGIQAVLSLVNDFEYNSATFFEPVQEDDWKVLGIDRHQIKTPDFLPVSQESIKEGVLFLETQVAAGKKTYVHCKAGRGRSTTVVVCYLLKAHPERFFTAKDMIQFVKEKRPDINLNPKQRTAVFEYAEHLATQDSVKYGHLNQLDT